jgi:hypothetical protein
MVENMLELNYLEDNFEENIIFLIALILAIFNGFSLALFGETLWHYNFNLLYTLWSPIMLFFALIGATSSVVPAVLSLIGSVFGVAISYNDRGIPKSYSEQYNLTSTRDESLYFTKFYFRFLRVVNILVGLLSIVLAIRITLSASISSLGELYISSVYPMWRSSAIYTCDSTYDTLTNSFTASNGGTVDEFCSSIPNVTYCCSLTK